MILSIDPGKHHVAWALWARVVGFELVAAGLTDSDARTLAERCQEHALALVHRLGLGLGQVSLVAVEQMQLSTGRDRTLSKAIATGNDLLELQAAGAYVAGAVGGRFKLLPPNTWKGTAPKDVTRARVEKTLSQHEFKVLAGALASVKPGLRHNVYDAVGIGLHVTGRYVVRGGAPGSAISA